MDNIKNDVEYAEGWAFAGVSLRNHSADYVRRVARTMGEGSPFYEGAMDKLRRELYAKSP